MMDNRLEIIHRKIMLSMDMYESLVSGMRIALSPPADFGEKVGGTTGILRRMSWEV